MFISINLLMSNNTTGYTTESGMSENTYKMMPEIYKEDVPLSPTVSSIGSVTYGVAKN